MVRETGTSRGSQKTEQSGPAIQISKVDWDYERISRGPTNCMSNGVDRKAGIWRTGWKQNANWLLHRVRNHTNRWSRMDIHVDRQRR
jgi:hypothetical protein